jgi:hypothetical protein
MNPESVYFLLVSTGVIPFLIIIVLFGIYSMIESEINIQEKNRILKQTFPEIKGIDPKDQNREKRKKSQLRSVL